MGCWVEEGAQVKRLHVEGFHSVIHDAGVSVEAGPRVDVEPSVCSVEHVGDAVRLECLFVFCCVPTRNKKL